MPPSHRHAFGDQYRATDFVVDVPGKLEMSFVPADGGPAKKWEVYSFEVRGGAGRKGRQGAEQQSWAACALAACVHVCLHVEAGGGGRARGAKGWQVYSLEVRGRKTGQG